MLILSRKFNESIIIDGRIVVKVVRLDSDVVKLGIEAPMDVPVHRQEIFDEIQSNNREAMVATRMPVPRLIDSCYSSPVPAASPAAIAPVSSLTAESGAKPEKTKASSESKPKPAATATPKTKTRSPARAKRAS